MVMTGSFLLWRFLMCTILQQRSIGDRLDFLLGLLVRMN